MHGTALSTSVLALVAADIGNAAPLHLLPPGDMWSRRWALVADVDGYQAWIIAWPVGSGLGLHDHRGSSAGVYVSAGRLWEGFLGRRDELRARWWLPGQSFELGPTHTHKVKSLGHCEAISIHVYSPRLKSIRFRSDPTLDIGDQREPGSGTLASISSVPRPPSVTSRASRKRAAARDSMRIQTLDEL